MKTTMTAVIAGAAASLMTLAAVRWTGDAQAAAPTQDDKEVRAEKFVLVNAKGDVRAVIATDKNGKPVIGLVDGNGKVRLSMAVTKDDLPAISMTDSEGRGTIAVAVTKGDDAAFTLSDKKGKVQAALSVEGGTGKLTLNGEAREK